MIWLLLWTLLAPGAITDLRVSAVTDSSAVLTWTEVPSGTTGIARYAVRYGPSATFTWAGTLSVTTGGCAGPVYGSTVAGGRTRSCVLSGLSPNLEYRFQVVAYTGNPVTTTNWTLSNTVDAVTAERIYGTLVLRPRLFSTTITVASASLSDFGDTRFPLSGTFATGSRTAVFYDSSGARIAAGYLIIIP